MARHINKYRVVICAGAVGLCTARHIMYRCRIVIGAGLCAARHIMYRYRVVIIGAEDAGVCAARLIMYRYRIVIGERLLASVQPDILCTGTKH